jgi:membrane protein required for colicin V production
MTSFDLIVLAILGLSILFAFLRGVIRELIALIAWVLGAIAALAFTPTVATWVPEVITNPAVRYLIAFAVILIAALLLGALVAWPLVKAVRAAGLGFADRFLGSIFGLARGLLVVVALVLLAGLTDLPRAAWWQDSVLAAPLSATALALATHLPPQWAGALDYSPSGRKRSIPVELNASRPAKA